MLVWPNFLTHWINPILGATEISNSHGSEKAKDFFHLLCKSYKPDSMSSIFLKASAANILVSWWSAACCWTHCSRRFQNAHRCLLSPDSSSGHWSDEATKPGNRSLPTPSYILRPAIKIHWAAAGSSAYTHHTRNWELTLISLWEGHFSLSDSIQMAQREWNCNVRLRL